MSIATTDVTLCWELLPLSKQEGLVLYYQVGVVQNKKGNHYSKLHHCSEKLRKFEQDLEQVRLMRTKQALMY